MMAAAEQTIASGTLALQSPLVTALMPQDLKDKGWKLERRLLNDEEVVFLAGHEGLGIYTGRYPDPDEAIEGAIILQAREEGKSLSPKQAKAELARMRKAEETLAGNDDEGKDIGGFRPSPDASPLHQAQIRLDGGTQPRQELDTRIVDRYAEDMASGFLFPPVVVFYDGKDHWLADGFHRFFAYKKCLELHHPHRERILQAEIKEGTKRDAVLYSLGANATHGLPRSAEDKYLAVMRLLQDPEWKQWSDSAIAGAAKVSQPFVSAIRREIDKPAESLQETSPTPLRKKIEKAAGTTDLERFKSTGTRKIGKDKVVRETTAIGKRPAATAARKDIQVDEAPAPVSTNGNGLAIEAAVNINLTIKAGKNPKRGITISGRAGEGKPIFLSDFTLADLQPMPPALASLMTSLAKTAARSAAAKASAAKPKDRKK